MRLRKKGEAHCLGKAAGADFLSKKIEKKNLKKYTRRQLKELFFENCSGCIKMSAIPQGAFATRKVCQNNNKRSSTSNVGSKEEEKNYFYPKASQKGMKPTPLLQYNSKLMNSIWGLYNRYSVHNFKKIIGSDGEVFKAAWGVVFENNPPSVFVNKAAVKNS